MIETADKYEEQLNNLKPIDGDEWYNHHLPVDVVQQHMVSTYKGEIIGSIGLLINIAASAVLEISAISFTETYRFTFGKDVMSFIRYLMHTYRKCSFFVLIGNPEEITYDRISRRLGWKIAGIMKKQVLNSKGEWNDIKLYEYINPSWRPRNDPE
jgi:hypothetical protein